MATTLDMEQLTVKCQSLYQPPQIELAVVLQSALRKNFADATVRVVDCPDLTQRPFNLAAPGLCGSPRVAEVGGVPNLIPSPRREKLYSLWQVPAACGLQHGMLLGAGAGPWPHVGKNSEMIPNLSITEAGRCNKSHVVSVEEGAMVQTRLPADEARSALLCNMFVSKGEPGKVFEIVCEKRTGADNFISCLRKALQARYNERTVAMGGVFLIEAGKAKVHVMPDFCATPIRNDDDLNKWLRFYEASAPLVCCTSLLSTDPGLDFRLEHTHCFSEHGEGGHYHCDTTPAGVRYRAYLQLAESAVRIDAPTETHQIGRD
ncbi:ester hydrolase C11orf54 homolog isoform X1 [Amphibalanus amphitrite]|uniref:ester hydrolase C11orf54 homolog isoform X1 n=1 Tax=Amphibalanus amphitrite TaxID=1232801 RepID=UPI001C8FE5B6|nr:ester hydrolase C11orf54 homolog isoform X1 [Amphibalanus amphitrite]